MSTTSLVSGVHDVVARWAAPAGWRLVLGALAVTTAVLVAASDVGVRDPAWSPDGRRIAVSVLDQVRVMNPDGRNALVAAAWPQGEALVERDPAWSRDGTRIAFAANRGDGYDIFTVPAGGGTPTRVTTLTGDERWPSWTSDDRLVFAHFDNVQWDLWVADLRSRRPGSPIEPAQLTDTPADETEPRVSPDGNQVLYVSNEGNEDGDPDLWVRPLPKIRDGGHLKRTLDTADAPSAEPASSPDDTRADSSGGARRVVQAPGAESSPTWAPTGDRIAYAAMRDGVGALWVSSVEGRVPDSSRLRRPRPSAPPILVSRRAGSAAWSPDGLSLLVTDVADADPVYNGNPARSRAEPPPLFGLETSYRLRLLAAPRPVDAGEKTIAITEPKPGDRFRLAFDTVWTTLRDLYYRSGEAGAEWQQLRDVYRGRAEHASDEHAFETVVDELVSRQPLIKPLVTSSGAVVVSGHRLASEAGARAFELGGNVVDAAIATAFALGVVEPEASGLGGDGTAVVYLTSMSEPTVIDYKDQTPIHATLDNPRLFQNGRLVGDGAAAANIPGVVAGLDYMFQHYGSKRVTWEQLIEPAIALAEDGYVLDEALPTTIAEGRGYLEKYPEARRIFLPDGRVPRPGDRFVNRDYARTLRTIAREGGRAFYTGSIARAMADDLQANGGILTLEDFAQYRAIERRPIAGRFRGHRLYGPPPPISSEISLIETLQVLDGYTPPPGARFFADATYLHYLIESWKVRDPLRRVADPERWAVDYERHLDAGHAADLFKRIEPRSAMPMPQDAQDDNPPGPARLGRGTTAFAVADAKGNLIALTQTLSTWGGTFYVSKGLGFLYNNHLRSNRLTPGAYGQMLPLMRSSTTSNPTLVFKDTGGVRTPWFAVGCAGNAWITSTVYSVILNVIDGLSAQAAIEAPRVLVGRDPTDPDGRRARVQIEDRFPRAVLDDLAGRGHVFQKIGRKGEVRYGYASLAVVDTAAGIVSGGAEPRRSHAAVPVGAAGGH
ncbi:MAG: gamma-glutamyltransferase [Vicinamibacterales bacterium]